MARKTITKLKSQVKKAEKLAAERKEAAALKKKLEQLRKSK